MMVWMQTVVVQQLLLCVMLDYACACGSKSSSCQGCTAVEQQRCLVCLGLLPLLSLQVACQSYV